MKYSVVTAAGLVVVAYLVFTGAVVVDKRFTVVSDGKWDGLVNYIGPDGARSCLVQGNGEKVLDLDGDVTRVEVRCRGASFIRLVVHVNGVTVFDESDSYSVTWRK